MQLAKNATEFIILGRLIALMAQPKVKLKNLSCSGLKLLAEKELGTFELERKDDGDYQIVMSEFDSATGWKNRVSSDKSLLKAILDIKSEVFHEEVQRHFIENHFDFDPAELWFRRADRSVPKGLAELAKSSTEMYNETSLGEGFTVKFGVNVVLDDPCVYCEIQSNKKGKRKKDVARELLSLSRSDSGASTEERIMHSANIIKMINPFRKEFRLWDDRQLSKDNPRGIKPKIDPEQAMMATLSKLKTQPNTWF